MQMSFVLAEADWTNIGSFFVTLCALAVTLGATLVNLFQYLSLTSAEVIVYAKQDETNRNILLLVIENIGKAPAHAVRFKSYQPIPVHAFGIEESEAKNNAPEFLSDGPLINGISFLAPGGSRILTWGQYGGLAAALKGSIIRVDAEHTTNQLLGLWERRTTTTSYLDIHSFLHCDSSDRQTQGERELEKISQTLRHVADGFYKPLIRVVSESTYQEEQTEIIEELKEKAKQLPPDASKQ